MAEGARGTIPSRITQAARVNHRAHRGIVGVGGRQLSRNEYRLRVQIRESSSLLRESPVLPFVVVDDAIQSVVGVEAPSAAEATNTF